MKILIPRRAVQMMTTIVVGQGRVQTMKKKRPMAAAQTFQQGMGLLQISIKTNKIIREMGEECRILLCSVKEVQVQQVLQSYIK